MIVRALIVVTLLLSASSSHADGKSDLLRALAKLGGTTPISTAYESHHTNVAHGRFFNDDLDTRSNAIVVADTRGLTVTVPRAAIDHLRQQRSGRDSGSNDNALAAGINTSRLAELLDYAPSLGALVARAHVVSEEETRLGNMAVRLLRLSVPPIRPGTSEVKVDANADSLAVWMEHDGTPVRAELRSEHSIGFLFLKASGSALEEWTFRAVGDRLVVIHRERTTKGGGMGQTSSGSELENMTIGEPPK